MPLLDVRWALRWVSLRDDGTLTEDEYQQQQAVLPS